MTPLSFLISLNTTSNLEDFLLIEISAKNLTNFILTS